MASNPFQTSPYSIPESGKTPDDFADSPQEAVASKPPAPVRTGGAPTKADLARRASELGVDPELALSFFTQESSGNWNSRNSPKGAVGGMQVMSGTYKAMMGTSDGQGDPWNNMEAGLRYIAYGQKRLGTKNPELLAAGYHAGYDRKDLRAGRIPGTNDGMISTADYAKSVAARVRKARGLSGKSDDEGSRFADTPEDALRSAAPMFVDTREEALSMAPSDAKFRSMEKKPEDQSWFSRFTEAGAEGYDDMASTLGTTAWAFGKGTDEEAAAAMAESLSKQSKRQQTAAQQKIDKAYNAVTDAKGVVDTTVAGAKALWASATNPEETSIEIARNAANSLPSLVLGAAGAGTGAAGGAAIGAPVFGVGAIPGAITGATWGGRAGMVIGTTATELGAEVREMVQKRLQEQKLEPTAQNVLSIISDKGFKEKARNQGLAKGLTIAAVDQLFMFAGGKIATAPTRKIALRELADQGMDIATRTARNKALSSAAGKAVLETAKPAAAARIGTGVAATLVDAAGESIGEGLSQQVARGEVDYGESLREGVVSLGQSAAQTGIGTTIEGAKVVAKASREKVDVTGTPPSQAAGPLQRAKENAATEPERVIVTAKDGQVAGTVTGQTESGVQVTGDDGQVYQFTTGPNGVKIAPVPEPAPLSNAIETAANDNAATVQQETPETSPAQQVVEEQQAEAPAEPEIVPQPEQPATTEAVAASPEAPPTVEQTSVAQPNIEAPALSEMTEPELSARLKYIAGQAKTNGGWNKMLSSERSKVEREINKRVEQAAQTPAAVDQVEHVTPQQTAATLPKDLAGAKPRSAYGKKQFDLTFENDVDKAAYIAAQTTPSKRDADYVKFAMDSTGMTEDEVRAHGAKVRSAIKEMGKNADPGLLTVSDQRKSVQTDVAVSQPAPTVGATEEGAGASQPPQDATTKTASKEDLDHLFGVDKKRAKAMERIAKGTAFFHDGVKAKDFIKKNGLSETHEVKKGNGGRWDVVAKAEAPAAQPKPTTATNAGDGAVAPERQERTYNIVAINEKTGEKPLMTSKPVTHDEAVTIKSKISDHPARRIQLEEVVETAKPDAQETGTEGLDRFITETDKRLEKIRKNQKDAIRNAGDRNKRISDAEEAIAADKQAKQSIEGESKAVSDFIEGKRDTAPTIEEVKAKQDAPGTRINGEAERAAADRLEKLHEQMGNITHRNGRERSAKVALRSIIEELRKPKTVVSIVPILDGAANGLDKNYGAMADVVRDVAATLDGQNDELDAEMRGYERKAEARAVEFEYSGYEIRNRDGWADDKGKAVFRDGEPTYVKLDDDAARVAIDAYAESKKPKAKPVVTPNKVFTEDAAEKARALLRSKLSQLNSGIDPEIMQAGITLAGYHIEKGARTFAAYAQAMVADLGDVVKPYLKSWYMGLKYDPRAAGFDGMSVATDVEQADIDAITAQADNPTIAETQEVENGNQTEAVGDTGDRTLERAPSEEVQGTQAGRDAEQRSPEGSGNDAGRAGGTDSAGVSPGSGVGDGEGTVPVPARGRRGKRGSAGKLGVSAERETQPDLIRDVEVAQAKSEAPASDYRITDLTRLGEGGQKTKYRNNVAAIRLLNELQSTGRQATAAEQDILARYVGWGGVSQAFDATNKEWAAEHAELKELLTPEEWDAANESTQYAHYTSQEIIGGIYDAVKRFGFNGGKVLEPGSGVGNFMGLLPEAMRGNTRFTAVERERIAGGIAKALYPNHNVQMEDFRRFHAQDGFFDLAIGNPPFASTTLVDLSGRKHLSGLSIHNYFFAKSIDMLREGGVLAMVVSNSFLDAKGDKARRYIGERTEFLGAIRLPNKAFSKNANTEVTTDIIFLKKRPESEWGSKAAKDDLKRWLDVAGVTDPLGGDPIPLNQYFVDHPEMMLGRMERAGSMYGQGQQPALIARDGQNTADLMRQAVGRLPEGVFQAAVVKNTANMQAAQAVALSDKAKVDVGGHYVEDGKLFVRIDDAAGEGRAVQVTATTKISEKRDLGKNGLERIKALADMRVTVRALLAAEMLDDPKMSGLRDTLNEQYDAFQKEFGYINGRTTIQLFGDDPDFPLLASLEHGYDPGVGAAAAKTQGIKPVPASANKAPIFTGRVIEKHQEVQKADSPADALMISIAERGQIDADYIGKLLDRDGTKVLDELTQGNNPALFIDPATGGYVLKDAYLSGNVRKKMTQAKAAGMYQNAAALEKVIPEDIPAHEISGKIGAAWVPTETYQEFASEIMGEGTRASVVYVPANSAFITQFTPGSEVSNKNTFGTRRIGADEIFSSLLNSREIKIGHYEEDPVTRSRRFVLEKDATDEANDKAREIKDKFNDWLFSDAARAEKLQRAYNDAVNNYVTRVFDGSMLRLPGKVPDSIIRLRRHQRNAVARIIQDGRALLDHVVGAGKAQPLDSKLLTPRGWVRMGDIKVGDLVITQDGTKTLVEAIFPQGDKEIFRVTFSDGSSTECCDEHLWLTQTYRERTYSQRGKKQGKNWACGEPKVRNLAEIRQTLTAPHRGAKNHSIPMVGIVQFAHQEVPLDPYLLGALIGDGHIGEKAVSLSGADDEVFYSLSLPEGVRARENGDEARCKAWHFIGTESGKNPMLDAMRSLGLSGKLSHEKFVPDAYKFNSPDVRLAVLRGLMDTDGWVEKAGKTTAFTTTSRQLANDVAFLVQSFGGVALETSRTTNYTHNGEKKDGRESYRLTIKMPPDINPFHIARKRDAVVPKTSYAPARYIVSVEPVGQKPAQCIRVAHESHLYVTDDFIVTHNTYTVIAAAMEMKRTGLAKKPLIVVPNHLVKQWAADFYRLYPGANILTATKKDFEKANRRKFLAKIATGNWDAVIMAHSSYGFIKPDPVFEMAFNKARIDEVVAAMESLKDEKDQGSKRTVKQLAKMKEGMENKLASLRDRPMDDLLDFGQLGVDQLFVDEAHLFKNLMYVTKMQNVRGLGQAKGSQRAYDMFIKTHQIYQQNGNGRGVVFATGTPVSNSLAEMYHMLRYLAPEALKDSGQDTFDAWAKTFADVEQVWMQSMSGDGYKASNRMSVFVNTPELLRVFNQVADTVTIDDIKAAYSEENNGKEFPIPALKGGRRAPVSIPRSQAQTEYMDEIAKRAKALEQRKGKPQKGEDNMLSIMGDARKAAMDIRMVRPDVTERDPNGRIAMAARNIFERYQQYDAVKGTQLVFSDMGTPKKHAAKELSEYNELMEAVAPLSDDNIAALAEAGDESAISRIERAEEAQRKIEAKGADWLDAIKAAMRGFSIYDDLKDALVEMGIPEKEVAFIHDYNTDDQKAALFRAVNDGKVRVLLGSTEKMGAGTNVQQRAVALHHLDVPWKPSDIEQREGRVIRQGNSLIDQNGPNYVPGFEVEVMAYATQDTLDLFMWQTQEKKLSMIGQLRTGNVGREVDNAFEEMQMSAGEMQAAATSNPYLLEEIQLKDKIKKLERKKRSFEGQKNDIANRLARAKREVQELPEQIKQDAKVEKAASETLDQISADFTAMAATVNGKTVQGAANIRNALRDAIAASPKKDDGKPEIKIEFNGKTYTSEGGIGEAIIKTLGDAAEVTITLPDGKTVRRAAEFAGEMTEALLAMPNDAKPMPIGKIGPFDVEAYRVRDTIEAVMSLNGDDITSVEMIASDAGMLMNALRGLPLRLKQALTNQRGVSDHTRQKLEKAKRAVADIEKMPGAGEWDGEAELQKSRQDYKAILKKLAERTEQTEAEQPTGEPAGEQPAFSRLESVFSALEGDGRNRIMRVLDYTDEAEIIRYIDRNFVDILGDLDDAGRVKIEC